MLVMVDVDSTLYDADRLFNQLFTEAGFKWIKNSPSWFGPEAIGCTRQDMKNLFRKAHSREQVMAQKPYRNAAEVLEGLVLAYPQVEIAYVSDRHPQAQAALKEWLEENGFLLNEDQHVAATTDKREWMEEARPSIVIDDRVRTMMFAHYKLGAQVASLEHAHNVNLKGEFPGVYICKNWDEIGDTLHEKIIPAILSTKDLIRG